MNLVPLSRRARLIDRRFRQARMLAKAFRFAHQPVAAHLIPVRRCNLSCTYCNEFDEHSPPVPTELVLRRVDLLAALGTGIVTMSGGEPLLHPDLDEIIRRVRARSMIATVITNGYLLTPRLIESLNAAGLDSLQVSIDNVTPDPVSKKSLKLLDAKLRCLAEHATFDVTVNAVVGGGYDHPDAALAIGRRARELGFRSTVGILHDGRGQLRPLSSRERQVLRETLRLDRSTFSFDRYNRFQETLAVGQPCAWHCPAGGRYLYVCEDGLVHYCSQQRGHPAIPLTSYGPGDLARESAAEKPCAPFCTIGCVHRVAMVDELPERPVETLHAWFGTGGSTAGLPRPIRLLVRLLVTGPERRFVLGAARRLFGMVSPATPSRPV
jgi:MoaA/NifB/PqqE/SkfB family radical SAM enzyme